MPRKGRKSKFSKKSTYILAFSSLAVLVVGGLIALLVLTLTGVISFGKSSTSGKSLTGDEKAQYEKYINEIKAEANQKVTELGETLAVMASQYMADNPEYSDGLIDSPSAGNVPGNDWWNTASQDEKNSWMLNAINESSNGGSGSGMFVDYVKNNSPEGKEFLEDFATFNNIVTSDWYTENAIQAGETLVGFCDKTPLAAACRAANSFSVNTLPGLWDWGTSLLGF